MVSVTFTRVLTDKSCKQSFEHGIANGGKGAEFSVQHEDGGELSLHWVWAGQMVRQLKEFPDMDRGIKEAYWTALCMIVADDLAKAAHNPEWQTTILACWNYLLENYLGDTMHVFQVNPYDGQVCLAGPQLSAAVA